MPAIVAIVERWRSSLHGVDVHYCVHNPDDDDDHHEGKKTSSKPGLQSRILVRYVYTCYSLPSLMIVIIMSMFMKKMTRWRRQRRNPNATANLHQRHTLSICCHYHHSRGSKKYQGEEKDKRRCLKFDFISLFNLSLGQENQTARNSRMFLRNTNRRFFVPLFWSGLKFSPK